MGKDSRIFRNLAGLRSLTAVLAFTCAVPGCSERPRSPVAPAGTPAGVNPPPPARGVPPTITAIVPRTGSATGGATTGIIGTGLMPGMVVTFDGIRVTGGFVTSASSIAFSTETPAHAVGSVDVVVTNPDGQSQTLAGGYTYVPPDSLDPNGDWGGYSLNGTDTWVEFEIRGSRIVSASCTCPTCTYDARTRLTFAEPASVKDGEFSVVAGGGATMSGRIVSESEMTGTISVPSCTTTPLIWRANRN